VELEIGENAPKIKHPDVVLTDEETAEAKAQFSKYDKDNSGTIDRAELKELLQVSLGKKMGPAMVERYVNSQMQLADKDGSGSIDFQEFLTVYKGMIAQSKGAPAGGIGIALPGMGLPGLRK